MLRILISALISCGVAAANPATAPADYVLAIVDVETTGLDPAHNEMIDLGAVYADVDGSEIARFFVRMRPDHPERAGAVARSINGFDEARWESLGAVSEEEAVRRFLVFHEKHAGGRTAIFTAYNATFDRDFLDALLKEHEAPRFRDLFTYYVLDLPSIAWGAGARGLSGREIAAAFGIEPETSDPLEHTGISGAAWNLELYRAMLTASAEN
ncbi:MAG: 3'-5' exonuclease [Pseudomonadota bacterium]